MTRPFKTLTVALGKGVDQATVTNAAESDSSLLDSLNLDFALKGGVRGRPGFTRTTGFSARNLSAGSAFSEVSVANLAASGFLYPAMFTARDGSAERPGLMTKGRLFTYDVNHWTDRLAVNPANSHRICDMKDVGKPAGTVSNDAYLAGALAYDFGPTENAITGSTTNSLSLLSTNGSVEARTAIVNALSGAGNGARCGNFTAIVHVPHGTNNLVLVTRNNGSRSVTETVLAADAQDPLGTGDAPCICCDYDETTFFVVYWTTVAGTYKALKVTTAGAISATHTHATGVTPRGIWISNGAQATNKTVVAYTGAGILGGLSRVLTTSTWANAAIDLAIAGGPAMTNSGQIVVGGVEAGNAWISFVNDPGEFHIAKRSVTAGTLTFDFFWQGQLPNTLGGAGGGVKEGATFFIQHQPINVAGRILMGISMTRSTGISFAYAGCTWLVIDLTNLQTNGSSTWGLRDPSIVAKGESYRSMVAWGPQAAVLGTDGFTYRFPTTDWQILRYPGPAVDAGGRDIGGTLVGERGMTGLNEINLIKAQVAHYKQSSVIAGSVPRMFSRGSATPVGFPWLEAPTIQIEKLAGGGGAQPLGTYTFVALWSWVDDGGQVHYSEPSFPITVNVNTGGIQRLNIVLGNPHFNERETGTVYTELYMTAVNPASGAPRLFSYRKAYAGRGTLATNDTFLTLSGVGVPIYTDGLVLEAQEPNASGGCATVGGRCWVSDGTTLYASRLGSNNTPEAPSWHIDGTLSVAVPPVAGRVVGLAGLDNKLVVFCERGIYVTGGEGPDDVGQGPGFVPLEKVSDLGCASQRSIASAAAYGVFFQSANTGINGDIEAGGLYLLDRGLTCKLVSAKVLTDATSTTLAGDVVFLPEKEQVYWWRSVITLMYDLKTQQWTRWEPAPGSDTFQTGCAASGSLWACGTEPMVFDRVDGQDITPTPFAVQMLAIIGNINIASGGMVWGRVRSMSVLGDITASYDLDQSITLDDTTTYAAATITLNSSFPATWPTGRNMTEWRTPTQKCSTIKAVISAQPAVAVWTAINFEVYTNGGKAPSGYRQ